MMNGERRNKMVTPCACKEMKMMQGEREKVVDMSGEKKCQISCCQWQERLQRRWSGQWGGKKGEKVKGKK